MTEKMISSYIPFPNIWWWLHAIESNEICFDNAEHFQKMSYRNRYYISGSGGLIQLSIPLVKGREQRTAMKDVLISDKQPWQRDHWRTLTSVYKRSPYFEHYEQGLQQLYEQSFTDLMAFNLASIHWIKQQLKLTFNESSIDEYVNAYEEGKDARRFMPGIEKNLYNGTAIYYQLFADRNGFIANLSILDLLFSEGPQTALWIKKNKNEISKWKNN